MSIVWLIFMLVSLGALLISNPSLALTSMIDGANGAVNLVMKLTASYALWMGFFSLLEGLGVSQTLSELMRPLMNFLFPTATQKAKDYASMNISANILGLGNAATPMGIRAMKELNGNSTEATDDTVTLVVISATSLQLLPTTVLTLRASAGSTNPALILFPTIVATVVSTIVGVCLCKLIVFFKKCKNKQPIFKNTLNKSIKMVEK